MCGASARKIVLVVDDDQAIRDSLADFLREDGYTVVTAADGRDALAKIRTEGGLPCLILLDLMMPVMNGAEFYAALQADPCLAQIPVVVLSADGNVHRKAQSFGGEYLAKPIKIGVVLDTIERYCG